MSVLHLVLNDSVDARKVQTPKFKLGVTSRGDAVAVALGMNSSPIHFIGLPRLAEINTPQGRDTAGE